MFSWSFLHFAGPPNLIYSNGRGMRRKKNIRRERKGGGEGAQNDLLFPEARTYSYCGGHRLSSAQHSEHYSACFNDARSAGGRREAKIEIGELTWYQKTRREGGRQWRHQDWTFFLLNCLCPPPHSHLLLSFFPPPLKHRKCTSLSTSILKGSAKLSNLSAILYIIACLNPHWNLGCYATIIWPLISSPLLHFLFSVLPFASAGRQGNGLTTASLVEFLPITTLCLFNDLLQLSAAVWLDPADHMGSRPPLHTTEKLSVALMEESGWSPWFHQCNFYLSSNLSYLPIIDLRVKILCQACGHHCCSSLQV